MPEQNPYDKIAKDLKDQGAFNTPKAPTTVLPTSTYDYAAQRTPDAHAQALKAQNEVGLPVPVAEQDSNQTAFQLRMRELDKSLKSSTPEVQQFMAGGKPPDGPAGKFAGVVVPGNIKNLYDRKILNNPDGSYSTTESASFNINGKEVLLPTVVDGVRLTSQNPDGSTNYSKVMERWNKTGEMLGVFDTPEHADAYAVALHKSQEDYIEAQKTKINPVDALTVSQDDIGVLDQLSRGLKQFWHSLQFDAAGGHKAANDAIITPQQLREPVYSFAAGTQGIQTGVYGGTSWTLSSLSQQLKKVAGPDNAVSKLLDHGSKLYNDLAQQSNSVAQTLSGASGGDRANMGSIEAGLNSGVESLPGNLATLAATAGLPEKMSVDFASFIGAAFGGFLSAGQERTDLIASGVPEERANAGALSNFSIETATEILPISAVMERAGGKIGFVKMIEKYGLSEQIGEQVATLFEDFSSEASKNPDLSLKDYIANHDFAGAAEQTFVATLVSTALIGGGLGALNNAAIEKQKAEAAKRDADLLTKLNGVIEQSKTRTRAPSVIKSFVESQLPGATMHIDAQTLVDILAKQDVKLKDVRDKVPAIDQQIDDALTMGGDVVVPASEWAAGMAGEKYNQAVIPHTRIASKELSYEDQQEFGEKQAVQDARKALDESTVLQDRQQQIHTIQQNVAQQLIVARPDLYNPETALQSATLIGSAYDKLSEDLTLGDVVVTPEEAFAKFPFEVVGPEATNAGPDVMNQEPMDYETMVALNQGRIDAAHKEKLSDLGNASFDLEKELRNHDFLGFGGFLAARTAIKKDPSVLQGIGDQALNDAYAKYTGELQRIRSLHEQGKPNPGLSYFKTGAAHEMEVSKRIATQRIAKGDVSIQDQREIRRQVEFEKFQKDNPGMGVVDFNQAVYHGTPHVFDKFSLQKIGTGEGAQAYGYGLYFAGSRSIAEYYAAKLSSWNTAGDNFKVILDGQVFSPKTDSDYIAIEKLNSGAGNMLNAIRNTRAAITDLKSRIVLQEAEAKAGIPGSGFGLENFKAGLIVHEDALLTLKDWYAKGAEVSNPTRGNLYEADIPHDEQFLNYDKPFKEQSAYAQEKLRALGFSGVTYYSADQVFYSKEDAIASGEEYFKSTDVRDGLTGKEIYHAMVDKLTKRTPGLGTHGAEKLASEELAKAGLAGIQYLDANSRSAGEGSHNYVVFDDKLVKILKRNDQVMQFAQSVQNAQLEVVQNIAGKFVIEPIDKGPTTKRKGLPNPSAMEIDNNGRRLQNTGAPIDRRQKLETIAHPYAGDEKLGIPPGTANTVVQKNPTKFTDQQLADRRNYKRTAKTQKEESGRVWATNPDTKARELVSPEQAKQWGEPAAQLPETFKNKQPLPEFPQEFATKEEAQAMIDKIQAAQFQQENRGNISFTPGAVIQLQSAADMSTFLHEFSHMLLRIHQTLADNPEAPSVFRERMQIIKDWTGDVSETEMHEKFATGFEQYLFQGKAPNESLRSVFRAFSSWLKDIYKKIANLGSGFSPEVRHVVESMIASENQVDMKESQLRATPMFESRDKANLTADEWDAYQATDTERTQKAVETMQTRSLREMKWLRKAQSKELSRLQKLVSARRLEAEAAARQEVQNRPIRQIENFLVTGNVTAEDGSVQNFPLHKLNISDLEAMYTPLEEDNAPVPDWRNLKSAGKKLTSEDGLHPDIVAQMAGSTFTSGDELVRKLANLQPINDEIQALTDLTMLENYGDIYDKETLDRAVDIAVHNDALIKMAAIELKALGSAISVKTLSKTAKAFAEEAIGRKQVGRLRVKDFELAESRSARKALAALEKGNLTEAVMHKKNQILNGIAAKYAAQALDEVRDQIRYNAKFRKPALKQRIGRDTVEQVTGLLEQFGFREAKGTTRPTLASWIADQQVIGYDPGVPAWIQTGEYKAYSALTMDEFREVSDAIKAVEETGRNRQQVLVKGQAIEFEKAEAELVDSIHANAVRTQKQGVEEKKGLVEKLKKWKSELTLFDFTAREIDGWKDFGPMHNILVTMKNKASVYEAERQLEAYKQLNELQKILGKVKDTASFIPEINMSLTRNQRIKFALYAGTKESYQRLQDGGIYTGPTKLSAQEIRAVLDSLTKEEMNYVQGMWDFFKPFWAEIVEKEKRLKGYAPKPADVISVTTKHGEFPGGYFPIDYDRRGEGMHNDPDTAQEAYDKTRMGRYTGIVTKNGALNERVATIKDRPLNLDLSTLPNHVNEMIHDLAFHEWAIQSHKVLYSNKVKAAMLEHYPISTLDNLRKERANIIKGNIGAAGAGDQVIRTLKKWSAVGALAFNFHSGIMQPIGMLQAIPRIGATGLAVGVMRAFQNTARLELPSTYALEHSGFMRSNFNASTQELATWKKDMESSKAWKRIVDKSTGFVVSDLGFMWLRGMNNATNNVIWLGAESKARSKGGLSEEQIIEFADDAVRDTQGSGLKIDRSLFEQSIGGEILSMYYTFFSRTYNLSREIKGKTKSVKDVPRAAYHYGMMIGVASILATIAHGLASKQPDKDLAPDAFLKDAIAFLLNQVPVGREFGGLIQGYPYRGPAISSAIKQLYDMIPKAEKIVEGQ